MTATVKKDRQPRQSGGRFGTSEAAKRRAAMAQEAKPVPLQTVGAEAANLREIVPGAPPEFAKMTGHEIIQATAEHRVAVVAFHKVQQKLALTESLGILTKAAPDAARYLVELVRGDHEAAPHDVRLRAAGMLLEYAGIGQVSGSQGKDDSELSLSELEQRLTETEGEIDRRLTVATIHSDPSSNQPHVAPLSPPEGRPAIE